MSSNIEPPKVINNKREGLEVMLDVCLGLEEMTKNSSNPCVGMLYLKFKSEAEVDEWTKSAQTIISHHWTEKLKKPHPLHFLCVSKVCAKDTVDVFFAETHETCNEIAQMRFKGGLTL